MASNKKEGVAFGTVEMLSTLLPEFAVGIGYRVFRHIREPHFNRYEVFYGTDLVSRQRAGWFEVQQLPHERVLITFDYSIGLSHRDPSADEQARFQGFIDALIGRLAALGFVSLPEVERPKRDLGFSPPKPG